MLRRSTFLACLFASGLAITQPGCVFTRLFQRNPAPEPLVAPMTGQAPSKAPQELPPAESAKVNLTTAQTLDKAGKYPEAIGSYERARSLDPRLDIAHRLGVLYVETGQFDLARAEFDACLKKNPNDPEVLTDLGYSLYRQGLEQEQERATLWQEAERNYRLALSYNSKNKRAWVNLGMCLGQLQRYDEAMASFEKAVTKGQAFCNLGFILTTQGKREEAKKAYRDALLSDPTLQLARGALTRLERPTDADVAQDDDGKRAGTRATPGQRNAPTQAAKRSKSSTAPSVAGSRNRPAGEEESSRQLEPRRTAPKSAPAAEAPVEEESSVAPSMKSKGRRVDDRAVPPPSESPVYVPSPSTDALEAPALPPLGEPGPK